MAGRAAQIAGETNPILTQFAVGYKPLQGIARRVAPIVESLTETGTLFSFGKEGFLIYNTERALRADPKMIDFHLSQDTYTCVEHMLASQLDYKEIRAAQKHGAQKVLQLEKRAVNLIQRGLDVALENAVASILFSTTYYASGNYTTLTGGDQFSDYDNSDPIAVVDTGKAAARADMGIEPNTMLIGYTAWKTLKQHPQLLERIKYSQKGILNADLVAQIFDTKRVIIGEPVYSTDAGVFTDLWGDYIALIYVPVDDAGNVLQNEMVEGTTPHTVIIEEEGYPEVKTFAHDHVKKYTVARKYVVKNVSTSFGYLICDTVA